MVLIWGELSPRRYWAMCGDLGIVTAGLGVQMAAGGWRPEVLLDGLQRTGCPHRGLASPPRQQCGLQNLVLALSRTPGWLSSPEGSVVRLQGQRSKAAAEGPRGRGRRESGTSRVKGNSGPETRALACRGGLWRLTPLSCPPPL